MSLPSGLSKLVERAAVAAPRESVLQGVSRGIVSDNKTAIWFFETVLKGTCLPRIREFRHEYASLC
jgi:hypothetical protein